MEEFNAPVEGGAVTGWLAGDGRNVLMLHGGPGLRVGGYFESICAELGEGYRVAYFQQRGLAPSVESGPYDVATAVADVIAVLDQLGWSRTYLLGHSWGGHLALHVAVAHPDRLDGVLCIDPLGGVGDGGEKDMDEEFARRLPPDVAAQAAELDERAMRGEGTADDALTSLRLSWPAYYGDWESAPAAMDDLAISVEAYSQTFESIHENLPALEAALPSISVPVGFVVGSKSPLPPSASYQTAERIPGAWVESVDGIGHLMFMEREGCVRSALERLIAGS